MKRRICSLKGHAISQEHFTQNDTCKLQAKEKFQPNTVIWTQTSQKILVGTLEFHTQPKYYACISIIDILQYVRMQGILTPSLKNNERINLSQSGDKWQIEKNGGVHWIYLIAQNQIGHRTQHKWYEPWLLERDEETIIYYFVVFLIIYSEALKDIL